MNEPVFDSLRRSSHSDNVNFDITDILNEWEFEPGKLMVRRFPGKDGVEKIQLRLDLGIVQMNAEGRPDGQTPHDFPSMLDYMASKVEEIDTEEESEAPLNFSDDDWSLLQLEAIQFHHRCLCLFQLESFEEVIRDADHVLGILDFMEDNSDMENVPWPPGQIDLQVFLLRVRAKASIVLKNNEYEEAIAIVEEGLRSVREMIGEPEEGEEPSPEMEEIRSLEEWLESIRTRRPLSQREQLEAALGDAVKREDYEKAAHYRDALRALIIKATKKSPPKSPPSKSPPIES